MTVYLSAFAISSILGAVAWKFHKKYPKDCFSNNLLYNILIFISMLPPCLVAGFRSINVGVDSRMYATAQILINNGIQMRKDFEPLYILISKIVAIFSNGYIELFLIVSLIFCLCTYKSIFKYSPNPVFSIFLLIGTSYYFIFLNGMRQMLSISIIYFALQYLIDKKYIKFSIVIIIASLIHKSSIFAFLIIFCTIFSAKTIYYIIISILTYSIAPLLRPMVIWFLNNFLDGKYVIYFDSKFNTGEMGIISLIIQALIFAFMLYFHKNNKNDRKYNMFINLQFITTICIVLINYIPLMDRIACIFGFAQIISIPYVCRFIKRKNTRLCIELIIICLFLIHMLFTIVLKGSNGVLPYITSLI